MASPSMPAQEGEPQEIPMTFRVDQDACIGCGACEMTCPAVFELVDFKSTVKVNPVPDEERRAALEAEDGCPAGAISHA